MNIIENISKFIGRYMAVIVLIVAVSALLFSGSFLWINTSWINYLLMVVMFGMGLILKVEDFVLILSRPKEVICGSVAQYTIMPILALFLSKLFNLDAALTAGVILVGTCPGGTASNVITYLSKGDVALSVCMTSVNTLIAPVLTPLITYMLLNATVETNMGAMFLGIVNIVLLPIILGVLINKFFGGFAQKFAKVLPCISVFAICVILASVISHNAEKILTAGLVVFVVVVLHNVFGFLFGFLIGGLLGLNAEKIKAFSIEIGMQNSGLAAGLANTAFPALAAATVPGAIFSVWHNISGAILAAIYRNWKSEK